MKKTITVTVGAILRLDMAGYRKVAKSDAMHGEFIKACMQMAGINDWAVRKALKKGLAYNNSGRSNDKVEAINAVIAAVIKEHGL